MADQQKIAVITGAARNPATNLTCYRLIARGWRVVALDSPRPGTPDSIEVELSDRDAVKKAVDDTAGGLGPISLLIAGGLFYDVVPFAEVTPQEWRRYFDGHLGHAVNTCWAVAPHMIEAGAEPSSWCRRNSPSTDPSRTGGRLTTPQPREGFSGCSAAWQQNWGLAVFASPV